MQFFLALLQLDEWSARYRRITRIWGCLTKTREANKHWGVWRNLWLVYLKFEGRYNNKQHSTLQLQLLSVSWIETVRPFEDDIQILWQRTSKGPWDFVIFALFSSKKRLEQMINGSWCFFLSPSLFSFSAFCLWRKTQAKQFGPLLVLWPAWSWTVLFGMEKKTVLQGVNNLNLVSTLLPLIAAVAAVRLRKQIAWVSYEALLLLLWLADTQISSCLVW